MMNIGCGGCRGEGRHKRWCPWIVGAIASRLGEMSEQAEAMGDSIGANDMGSANLAYALAASLSEEAHRRAALYMDMNGTRH